MGTDLTSRRTSGLVLGRLDALAGRKVVGWIASPSGPVEPVLIVDGRPARLTGWPLPRQDVGRVLGADPAVGFEFEVPGAAREARYELFALAEGKLVPVSSRTFDRPVVEADFWRQVEAAAQVSADPEAVAVTSWDGAHNPIGRAKVLYDIVRTQRPAVLVTYLMGDFGRSLWAPLQGSDLTHVAIPWDGREHYERILRAAGVTFGTVWICKPRLPSFHLAAAVARDDARLILDLDDNEDHFSLSIPSRAKPYGLAGLSKSKMFEQRVRSRTTASRSLQEDYGGELVRHVRAPGWVETPSLGEGEPVRVGFLGTVRPHKRILEAARAIRRAEWAIGRPVELHVMGDVSPDRLVGELEDVGAVVDGTVPANEVPERLAGMHLLLTGFPARDASGVETTRYQITAKIGDGLALGRGVLVPETPAVADLRGTPGVYLFTEDDFYAQLGAAIDGLVGPPLRLPKEFTLESGYEAFRKAEEKASTEPRAGDVLTEVRSHSAAASTPRRPKLLLVWKQADSGLYGRRVDLVARAFKRARREADVHILEVMHPNDVANLEKHRGNNFSDAQLLLDLADRKTSGGWVDGDGVVRDQLRIDARADVEKALFRYLVDRNMHPDNTVVVLYPYFPYFPEARDVLEPYMMVVDVVDNHFAWTSAPKTAQRIAHQYAELGARGDRFLFNSDVNRSYFAAAGILPQDAVVDVVPNWYEPPTTGTMASHLAEPGMFHVVYSGNMNDRVDWDVLRLVASIDPNLRLHLVGGAGRAPDAFHDMLTSASVVYHGPQSEDYVAALLGAAHLAIVPHKLTTVSKYMNPLKVLMYRVFGVPVVASGVPGIDGESSGVSIGETPLEFVALVHSALASWVSGGRPLPPQRDVLDVAGHTGRARYLAVLEAAFQCIDKGRLGRGNGMFWRERTR